MPTILVVDDDADTWQHGGFVLLKPDDFPRLLILVEKALISNN